jgi:CheY-like chemotaxis protein
VNLPYRVMLLDDDHITNFLTESILAEAGFAFPIQIFTDPVETLQYIENQFNPSGGEKGYFPIPDLMFVDANMTTLDGFEFLQQLEKVCPAMYRNTMFCLLTNSSRTEDAKKAMESGFNTYIQKPLNESKLQAVIDLLLSRST